jgi:hypothetical protein
VLLALVPAEAPERFGVASSAMWMIGFSGLLAAFLAHAVVRAFQAWRLGSQASAAMRDDAPLAPGPAVVSGRVEYADDELVAARVEVDQVGTEQEGSGTWTTRWTESDRRVTMRPFYIRCDQDRVRVEPGDHAFLVDAMDGMILASTTERTRFAELSRGERVFAVGKLEVGYDPEQRGDYRGGSRGWVLRARPGEDLLLSSEPLQQRFVRRAQRQLNVALLAAAMLGAFGAMFSTYVARVVHGVDVVGTVIDRSTSTDSDDNTSYRLEVKLKDGGARLVLDASKDSYEAAAPGAEVPVRYVPSWPFATDLGAGAMVAQAIVLVGVFFLSGMAIARYFILRSFLAWYETKVVDVLSGRLEESKGRTSM